MANFKVGDKVTIPSRPSLGVCTIDDIAGEGFSGTTYYINTPVGLQKESESNLRAANSRAHNAMTDYGRELKSKIGSSSYPRKASIESGHRGEFTMYFPDGKFVDQYFKSLKEAEDFARQNGITITNRRACNSSNPVVRKALNAVACNALFKVGDRVLLKHGGADWGTIKLVAGKMHGAQQYRVTWDHNGEDVVFEDDLVTSQKDVR